MTVCATSFDHPAPALYAASVPVLLAVLDRMAATLSRAGHDLDADRLEAALALRPAPAMLPAARHAATAAQFTLRIACPLAGRKPPELRGGFDAPGLALRIASAREHLESLPAAAFAGAETRLVRFQAGFADLELPGFAYLHEFGLPNLYFHQAMVHVALKQAGVDLGKADFDGKHLYPKAFSLD
jgi:uncharacterized protein